MPLRVESSIVAALTKQGNLSLSEEDAMTERTQADAPEVRSETELVDTQRRMDETWAGERPVDPHAYPYFNPAYRLPFKHIGTQKQLFLDNYILDELLDVERVVVRPRKAESPLIQYDNLPWERYHFTCVPAAALYDADDRLFKMWYKTLVSGNTNSAQGTEVVLCYAESEDALNWRKPMRKDCQPFADSRRTNIVMRDFDNGSIVLNPDRSDPGRKFLAVYNPSMEATRRGERVMSRVAASPDGISWRVISDNSPFRHHHQMRVIWDDACRKWVGYSQASHAFASSLHIRTIGRQESADFINWSPKRIILSSDWDPNVGPNVEFHTMSVRKAGGLYIGIVEEAHGERQWLVNRDGSNQRDQFHTKAALYASRDGHRFFRADGYRPWADNGPPGSQDYGYLAHTVAGYLLYKGRMVIAYSAFPHKQRDTRPAGVSNHAPLASVQASRHHVEELSRYGMGNPMMDRVRPEVPLQRGIGALVLREDGWAALRPQYEVGQVITKQFVFEGDELRVNADCGYGLIRVALLDSELRPYPGFSLEESVPLHAPPERIWHAAAWKDSPDMRQLWNRPVRICFSLLESSLYGFRFSYSPGIETGDRGSDAC